MEDTLLGIDVGSSSVKVSLLDTVSGRVIASASSPSTEMAIESPHPGWAEQHPDLWWEHVGRAIGIIRSSHPKELRAAAAIGVAYQMHGLVLLDKDGKAVRPSIIWCDSRAVEIGNEAFSELGEAKCLKHFGNSPGNFTASKLAWVKRNEPSAYSQGHHCLLPGDYIALRLTGEFGTTPSGLSEAVLWNFSESRLASEVLKHFEIPSTLIPPISPNLGAFAALRSDVALELGLTPGIPVTYRAGDQPNNALALKVLQPGEVAANAGTSGVIYGVTDSLGVDSLSRVNNFLHINSSTNAPRIGSLMCVNGAGSFYRWAKHTLGAGKSYTELNALAETSPVGAAGVIALPYGNGAERTLNNANLGASFEHLDLNRHSTADIFRATQEGVVFALCYGLEIMRAMGLRPSSIRAGNANMFQSELFRRTFATCANAPVELLTTDGAEGAARGAGIGAGLFSSSEAFRGLTTELLIEPDVSAQQATRDAYERWKIALARHI
jgi:xylulokinase